MTRKELIAQLTVIAEAAAATPATQSAASVLFCLIGALEQADQAVVDALAHSAARFCRDRLRELDARQN